MRKKSINLDQVLQISQQLILRSYDYLWLHTMLEAVGLAAPQVTYIMQALKKSGLAVDTEITTIEEAKASILKALGIIS